MDLFEHAERYPNAPGYRHTDTSKAAARSVAPSTILLRDKVLACLREHFFMTADECAVHLNIDKLSIRPRFTELRELGEISDTGDRRANDSGRKAIVWTFVRRN